MERWQTLGPRPWGIRHDMMLAPMAKDGWVLTSAASAEQASGGQIVESKVVHEVNKPRRDEPAACTVANISWTTG
eukprot:scaffold5477_cov124-Isochrysis_galbana.AAC.5